MILQAPTSLVPATIVCMHRQVFLAGGSGLFLVALVVSLLQLQTRTGLQAVISVTLPYPSTSTNNTGMHAQLHTYALNL